MSMIVRPPSVSPAHQRRLKRTITRLLDRAHEQAERTAIGLHRTIITQNGTINPPVIPDLLGDVIGNIISNTIAKIRGVPVSGIAPTEGQALVFNGTEWIPGAPGDTSGIIIDYSSLVNEATTPRGATFSASSTSGVGTETAAYAADNDDSTYWLSAASAYPTEPAAGAWWKADLGTAKEITWYRVVQGATPFRASSSKLQSSTDNSTWTDQVTFGVFGDTGLLELPAPVTARYWRVLGVAQTPLVSLAANNWGLATVALYSGQPTEQAPGHTIEDEGTAVTQRGTLNFTGDGVAVADTGGKTTVTVSTASHDHTASAGDGGVLTNDEHDGYSEYAEIEADPSTPSGNKLRIYAKDKDGVSTLYYITDDGTVYELPTLGSGGAGSGAPVDAHYITTQSEIGLTNEVLLSAVNGYGLLADRPAAGIEGRFYYASDSATLFRDDGAGWDALSTGADELAKVSSNDTMAGYLNGKLVAGTGVTLTENDDGADETLTISTSLSGSGLGYRAWVYSDFSTGEFTYVVDDNGDPIYALMELE